MLQSLQPEGVAAYSQALMARFLQPGSAASAEDAESAALQARSFRSVACMLA